jgi:hypothetical protein
MGRKNASAMCIGAESLVTTSEARRITPASSGTDVRPTREITGRRSKKKGSAPAASAPHQDKGPLCMRSWKLRKSLQIIPCRYKQGPDERRFRIYHAGQQVIY